MIKTEHFLLLPAEVQAIFEEPITLQSILSSDYVKFASAVGNRADIFEVVSDERLIVKWYKPTGKRDFDILALLKLQGINHIPKLYAYQEYSFLVMEKAKGKSLTQQLLDQSITESELVDIRNQYEETMTAVIQKGLFDWDFKLEHIFWDKDDRQVMLVDFGEYSEGIYDISYINYLLNHFDQELEYYFYT